MQCAQLKGRTRKEFRPCRQGSRGACGVAENRSWASDITYIGTTEGWRYLAVWIDLFLFSRRVVGWKLERPMDASLVIEVLNRALGHRQVEPKQLLIHADQGSHCRATDYRRLLEDHKISCSAIWPSGSRGTATASAVIQRSITSARSTTSSSSSLHAHSPRRSPDTCTPNRGNPTACLAEAAIGERSRIRPPTLRSTGRGKTADG